MPVTLAALGELFAIGFLLISFIGWIMNLINAQNPPPAPNRGPQRRPQARDRKVQSEIEDFLQEAMGNKKRARAPEVPSDEIEVLEPGPGQRRRPPGRSQRRPPPARTGGSQQKSSASATRKQGKPGSGVASRHVVPSGDLGKSVTSHVQEHMSQRVRQEAEQNLPHAVDQTVANHLGEFTADDRDTRSTVKPVYQSRANVSNPGHLIDQLRNPDGMRQAIMLQEILSKPRMLRK